MLILLLLLLLLVVSASDIDELPSNFILTRSVSLIIIIIWCSVLQLSLLYLVLQSQVANGGLRWSVES
jgi:hypothetical protein